MNSLTKLDQLNLDTATKQQVTDLVQALLQAGRNGRHAQHFLRNWQGHLLVDDYAGYKALFSATTSPCIELGWLSACAAQILRSAPGQCQHDGIGSTAAH